MPVPCLRERLAANDFTGADRCQGYFQPVRIRAPKALGSHWLRKVRFSNVQSNEALVGLQIGPVYRLQVSDIPNREWDDSIRRSN